MEPWRGRSPLSGAMNEIELAVVAAAALSDEARTKPLAWISGHPGATGQRMNNEQADQLLTHIKKFRPGEVVVMLNPFEGGRVQANPSPALDAARRSANGDVSAACGIPPVLLSGEGDGTTAREAYRRFVRGTIEPIGRMLAHEASLKLGSPVAVRFDNLRASDVAMNARAFAALVGNEIPQDQALELSGLLSAG